VQVLIVCGLFPTIRGIPTTWVLFNNSTWQPDSSLPRSHPSPSFRCVFLTHSGKFAGFMYHTMPTLLHTHPQNTPILCQTNNIIDMAHSTQFTCSPKERKALCRIFSLLLKCGILPHSNHFSIRGMYWFLQVHVTNEGQRGSNPTYFN